MAQDALQKGRHAPSLAGARLDANSQDQELLRRWQEDSDRDALDELLRREVGELAAQIRSRAAQALRPTASASDLVQEAVFRLLRQDEMPRFEVPAQLRTYLWKSAWRLLQSRLGRRPVRRLSDVATQELGSAAQASSGFGEVEAEEQTLALNLALNLLGEDDRRVLELVYFEHRDVIEAAGMLGVSKAAAVMRLTRARRRLARRLLDWADLIG